MRAPAGHLAERLELLCLAQRLLGLPLLGPVEEGGDGAAVLVRTMKNLERSSAGLLAFHERRAASSLDLGIEGLEIFAEMVDFICHAGGQRFAAPKRPPRQLEHSREYLVPGEQAAIRIKCRDPLAHTVERCLQH